MQLIGTAQHELQHKFLTCNTDMFLSISPPSRRKSSVKRTLALPCLKWYNRHKCTEKLWTQRHKFCVDRLRGFIS